MNISGCKSGLQRLPLVFNRNLCQQVVRDKFVVVCWNKVSRVMARYHAPVNLKCNLLKLERFDFPRRRLKPKVIWNICSVIWLFTSVSRVPTRISLIKLKTKNSTSEVVHPFQSFHLLFLICVSILVTTKVRATTPFNFTVCLFNRSAAKGNNLPLSGSLGNWDSLIINENGIIIDVN